MSTHGKLIVGVLALLLLAALIATAILYPLATRPLVLPGDEALVERAQRDAVGSRRGGSLQASRTFPIVLRLSDRSCVELRSSNQSRGLNYLVCYAKASGQKIEEVVRSNEF